jgi:membrane-anchored protein YejM (alkaline phosphatase superfamily)
MHFIFAVFVLVFVTLSTPLFSKETPNVLWISVDGISRHTFYALLQKKQLPNIQKLIKNGNYRNLDILTPNPQLGYVHFLTGMNSSAAIDENSRKIKKGLTVFEKTKQKHSTLGVHLFLSETDGPQTPLALLNKANLSAAGITLVTSTSDIKLLAGAKNTMTLDMPMFLFIQHTAGAASVFRYREGTEHYSDTIVSFDKQVGDLLAHYKKTKPNRPLHVIISSSYGFEKNTRKPTAEAWVLSNNIIVRKTFSGDIVPTIFHLYAIPAQRPPYIGNRFF